MRSARSPICAMGSPADSWFANRDFWVRWGYIPQSKGSMAAAARRKRKTDWVRLCTTALVAALPVLAGGLMTGCQNVQGSSPQTMVRVIDASYNAPAIDVKVGTTPIATNIAAQTITNYAFLPPQNGTVYIYPTQTTKASASTPGQFLASEQHSLFLTDSGAGYTAAILTDQVTAPPAGYFSVRFLQQALLEGAVDVYLVPSTSTLSGSKPLLSNVAAQTISGYINVPAGTYTVVVTPTGVVTRSYSSASITFAAGQVRTMVIMDAQLTTNPPVTVVIGNDLN